MAGFRRGRYAARLARGAEDLKRCQSLRGRCFRADGGAYDADGFDARCEHGLVEDTESGALVCCFRLLFFEDGRDIDRSYAAQFYDLASLTDYEGRMAEMGRFCIDPDLNDPDVLRVAWGLMNAYVEDAEIALLFGCSSFKGTEADAYMDSFALLKERHLAPKRWLPRVKAPEVFRFANLLGWRKPDLKQAMKGMPPLLRSYLVMGGWVSDHAVVDSDLGTLHVFTGLEIASIPPARKRLLRNG